MTKANGQHVSVRWDALLGYMYKNCCFNFFFTCVFYWKNTAISSHVPKKCGKCFILVGVHSEFLWSCHFSNYGEKQWLDEFIVWVTEEFTDSLHS